MERTSGRAVGGEVSAAARDPTGTVPVTMGGEGGVSRSREEEDRYETAPGVVFAYRVHIIKVKGDGEDVEEMMFSHKKAFMTPESGDGGLDWECVEVSPEVLGDGLKDARRIVAETG